MSVTWIVQDNLGSTSTTAETLRLAVESEGQKYAPVQIVPFSSELPEMPEHEGKFVIYGRTTFIINAWLDKKWRPGVFFDPIFFTPGMALTLWREWMLNNDAQLVEVGDVPLLDYAPDDMLFVRPNDDYKTFTGNVMSYEDLCKVFQNTTKDTVERLHLKSKLIIASPKVIDQEWRLFMVDKKFVTGSQYLPSQSSFAPPEVIELAEKVAREWSPSDVYALDVCSSNGELRVIEFNCFNGSGFYASDLEKLVRVVSRCVESL